MKARAVLEVNMHPLMFQCYKTFWVFTTSWLVLFSTKTFDWTPWGIVAGLSWVPAGTCVIYMVPRVGVGIAVGLMTGGMGFILAAMPQSFQSSGRLW